MSGETIMSQRIYRSRSDAMLGGVCAGVAGYLNIDPVWVRLFFILLALGDGIGILFYIILWAILPKENQSETGESQPAAFSQRMEELGNEIGEAASRPHPNTVKFIGFGLIMVGFFYLLKTLNLAWLQWVNREVLFPMLLIAGGCILLYRAFRHS
jgi:phage shock protein PspC (stress-responsive transcriptional regulator)